MTTMNRGEHHAIFPNASVVKLEGTVLVGTLLGNRFSVTVTAWAQYLECARFVSGTISFPSGHMVGKIW